MTRGQPQAVIAMTGAHLGQQCAHALNEVAAVARENLLKAGCPENQIDFVLEYGGIYSAYENDLDCFKKFPEYAVMHLTTD